ncbi:MAG: hypothetical protein NT066_00330 [Candidatus Omnitrophica bacterium]|nr:hypothetical protein [Candidatus Omnitrophota bacterium]
MKLLKEQEILLLSSIIIVILSSCYYAFAGVRFINFFFEKEVTLRTILILSIWPALLFIGFTVAAMGILFFKRWALRLFLILNALIWGNSIKPLFSISYYSILGISNILLLVLSGVSIWFSLKKTTREQFGWSISEREKKFKDFNPKLGYFLATLFILIVCYYALSYFIIYPKQKIVYTQKPNAYFLSHFIKRDICNLTLFLPKDLATLA